MANTFHHRRGGDATYTLSLTRLLEENGHEVVPLAMRHPDNEVSPWDPWFVPWMDFREPASFLHRATLLRTYIHNRAAKTQIRALIARTKPQIVHIQHIHHHLTPSIITPARKAGVPILWTVHDYELICPNGLLYTQQQPCQACKGHRYHEAVKRKCKRNRRSVSALAALENTIHALQGVWDQVDRFLCPSQFMMNKLIEFGVPSSRVHHQPNFISPSRVPNAAKEEGILYAGRLTEEKGLLTLLEIARNLPEHPVTICGSGPLEDRMKHHAQALPNLRLMGHISAADLASEISRTALVVVPSRWYENFPYAVLEAQAAGKPVVASRIGGIPEQITHGVDGWLADPQDPKEWIELIHTALTNESLRNRIGVAAKKRVINSLSPKAHYTSITDHYHDVGLFKSPAAPKGTAPATRNEDQSGP